jgi:transposase
LPETGPLKVGSALTTAAPTDKQGSAAVRFVLEEAAERAKTRPPFAGFYAQCAARRGRHIATVAVARKLLARCFHVLTVPHVPATRPFN